MNSSIESIVRRHLEQTADGTIREGQIDRVTAAVDARRQVPGWYAGLRSPVPAVNAPPLLRGPAAAARLTRGRSLTVPAAIAVLAVALGWAVLGTLGGVAPSPSSTGSEATPSPAAGATASVPDCVTIPKGASATGCIEVAQGWTFTLGDHSPRIGADNDARFDVKDGVAFLSRPAGWAGALELAVATAPGRDGCLAAVASGQAEPTVTATPGRPGIDLEGMDSSAVLCAISGSGHVFEMHLLGLTPQSVATTTRVVRFAWIDWGTAP
jgi:hypothetical protein